MVKKKRGQMFDMDAALREYEHLKELPRDELKRRALAAVEAARDRKMSREEQEAQLISFVWGNAPEGNQGTRETVRKNLGRLANG